MRMSFLLLQSVRLSGACCPDTVRALPFRETQQEGIVHLSEGKDVLVSQPTASSFSVLPDHMHLRCCVDESDLLVVLWLPLCSTRLSRTEPGSLLQ